MRMTVERKSVGVAILAGLWAAAFVAGPGGATDGPRKTEAGVIVSSKSGAWSDPATWMGGQVPAAGARVRVAEGHTVTYDVASDQVIRLIHVAGTLTFSRERDTRLN